MPLVGFSEIGFRVLTPLKYSGTGFLSGSGVVWICDIFHRAGANCSVCYTFLTPRKGASSSLLTSGLFGMGPRRLLRAGGLFCGRSKNVACGRGSGFQSGSVAQGRRLRGGRNASPDRRHVDNEREGEAPSWDGVRPVRTVILGSQGSPIVGVARGSGAPMPPSRLSAKGLVTTRSFAFSGIDRPSRI